MKNNTIILFIDDSNSDRTLFRHILREIDSSIEFISASGGRQALEYLNSTALLPDYIFLDINMPGMNGMECLAAIKKDEALAQIPVVMYSTSDVMQYEKMARELGAMQYLTKSGDFDKSVREIASIIVPVENHRKKQ